MSPALAAIAAERGAQIAAGHDRARDADRPVHDLPETARDYLQIACDCARGCNGPPDLDRARRKLVQAAALILAALDHPGFAPHVADDVVPL